MFFVVHVVINLEWGSVAKHAMRVGDGDKEMRLLQDGSRSVAQ